MSDCLSIMMRDPGAAIGGIIHDRAPDGRIYASYVGYMKDARRASGKPVALAASRQGTGADPLVVEATHAGFPVLDGVVPFLRGIRGLMDYRDFLKRPALDAPAAPQAAIAGWRDRLAARSLDEAESLELLRDFGIAANEAVIVESEEQLQRAAGSLGFPLALKTAMPGIAHKSELRGVYLHLGDIAGAVEAYRELKERLGARASLAPMVRGGIEMMLGARRDPQFGPVVLLGFGGVLAEAIGDVVTALPPFDASYARRRLDELKLQSLLHGFRGGPAADIEAFCALAARFSTMIDALRDHIEEVDVNPVIVGGDECIAVDALVIGRNSTEDNPI